MKPTLCFVDDDRFYALTWIEKLRENHDVIHCTDAVEAYKRIVADPKIRCLVLDVMMPTPSGVSESETAEGFETGLWLLKKIHDHVRKRPLPVVILSNRDVDRIVSQVEPLKLPEGLVVIRRKLDTQRRALVEIVQNLLTTWQSPSH